MTKIILFASKLNGFVNILEDDRLTVTNDISSDDSDDMSVKPIASYEEFSATSIVYTQEDKQNPRITVLSTPWI